MTSFQSPNSLSAGREREFSSSRMCSRRRRRGCIFNKFFTKTGILLLLGAIILTALPTKGSCRPVEDHVYGSSSSSSHHSTENGDVEDEEAIGSRFEFQRKIVSKSSSTSSDDDYSSRSSSNNDDDNDDVNLHSLELIRTNDNDSNERNNPLLSNSSMIVHVIVTSSSSTSSSELETDSEPEGDDDGDDESIQYTVEVRDDNNSENNPGESEDSEGASSIHPSASSPSISFETLEKQDLSQQIQKQGNERNQQQRREDHSADHLELQKLPKSDDDEARPVQDIFSAFYSAFTQTSSSPPPPSEPEASYPPNNNDESNSSIATFSLQQPYFRTRRLPQSFQSFQQRRRLFRNRQKQFERKSFSSSPPQIFSDFPSSSSSAQSDRNEDNQEGSFDDVEETARKLEFLAKKLDKVEHNKILQPSPSSVVETSSAAPFLLSSSSSTFSTLLPPPKIAVSVTRSESVAGPKGSKSTVSSSAIIDLDDESSPAAQTRQRARVTVGVKRNAKNETFFGQAEEKLFPQVQHSSTPRLPSRRPKPLIKSLPKYDQEYNDDSRINNRNSGGNKNNSPRNFSNGHYERTEERGTFPERNYNPDGNHPHFRGNNNNNDGRVGENNVRILQDRQNIIGFSEDGDGSPNSSSSSSSHSNPSAESSSFVEITASRPSSSSPQRRKITRTVSGEIGDPSTYPFNLPRNNFQLPNRKSSQQQTTTTKAPSTPRPQPKVVNWQQPEKVWGEPARVWGVPAEVWGEPERVWGEPAKVWGNTEKAWQNPSSPPRKELTEADIDEMMQSDQPPEERGQGGEASTKETEDGGVGPQGTFVILGDDENEGDSIDGDLGRPLMLHHFTIPPKPKATVSISTSVSSSVSSYNNNNNNNNNNKNPGGGDNDDASEEAAKESVPFSSRKVPNFQQLAKPSSSIINAQFTRVNSKNTNSSSFSVNINNSESSFNDDDNNNNNNNNSSDPTGKKSGKKFGYVIEGANVRKYRVEERTPDGYIVGEYGVLNNQNAFLRGVRYTADGTINPRLIHEALMKFLSLRRR